MTDLLGLKDVQTFKIPFLMRRVKHPTSIESFCTLYLFLMCESSSVSQWHQRGAYSRGTPVLSARSPSPRTPPHPDPFSCPLTRWRHSLEACLLRHYPAATQTPPSLCPTHGPIRERTPLSSETAAPGETQPAQRRVIKPYFILTKLT